MWCKSLREHWLGFVLEYMYSIWYLDYALILSYLIWATSSMDPLSNLSMRMSGKYRGTLVFMRSVTTTKLDITRGQWLTTMETRGPRPIPHRKKLSLTQPLKCFILANVLMTVGTSTRSGHLHKSYLYTTKSIIDSKMIIAGAGSNHNGFHSKTGTGEMSTKTIHKISYCQDSKLVYASTSEKTLKTITGSSFFGALSAWYGLTACMSKIRFVDMTYNIWKSSVFDSIAIYFYYPYFNKFELI